MFEILLCIASFCLNVYAQTRPRAQTQCGIAQGIYMQSRGGRQFAAYLGIPYVQAPVGNLRFEPPQSIKNCPTFFDASKEGEVCLQPNVDFPTINKTMIGSEDCLTLNIFSPKVNTTKLLPVIVYFYEGSWVVSSSALGLHGPRYFMDEDVVLVTCNNRNNIFGYMSTEDLVVPGNMALKDQVAVLQYVKKNIAAFNGNANLVTLFGSSAGATTINLHMRSPMSRGLFKRGISQSGTATSAYSIIGVGTSLKNTKGIAARVNCSQNSTQDMVNCLKKVPAETLLQEHMTYLYTSLTDPKALFVPVVEPKLSKVPFLIRTPLKTQYLHSWMTGFCTADASYKYIGYATGDSDKNFAELDKNWDVRGPNSLMFDDTATDIVTKARKVKKFYFGNDSITAEKKYELINMYTNFFITNPMIKDIHKNIQPTYVYQFDHFGQYSRGKPYVDRASHRDENIYLFEQNATYPNLTFNQVDLNISKLMIKLWVNFATYGNPTPFKVSSNPQNPSAPKVSWVPYNIRSNRRSYFLIQTNSLSMQNNLFKKEYDFWRTLNVTDKLRSNYDDAGFLNPVNRKP